MPKLTVTLYGRDYQLACPDGQERRVQELVNMVEQRMRTVASSVGNTTENRLFMLTCMMLADEMLELREAQGARRPAQASAPAQAALSQQDEEYLLNAISHLQNRLDHLTAAVGNA
ncbi:MAG: cell division protein ZapA [Alphaproteobacteria bacterium]|nr:cell division protein ZapA [Alphaproteobacteria bacterium]